MKKIKAETVALRERRGKHNCFQNEEVSWGKRREKRNQNKGKKNRSRNSVILKGIKKKEPKK